MSTVISIFTHLGTNPETFPTALVPTTTEALRRTTYSRGSNLPKRKNTFRNSVKWTTFDLAEETHTRVCSVCESCSTRATTALTSDGEQSFAKRKPPSADTDWQLPQMSKLQRKTTLGSRSLVAPRATHHQMSGTANCLCQTDHFDHS